MSRKHDECPGEYEKWYVGPVGKGRKKKDGVIYTGEIAKCDCTCHGKD